jgi:spore coat-associated protein N
MRGLLIAILALAALAAPATAHAEVLQTNSKNGSAILTAGNMKPGDTVTDTVTIANPTARPAAYVVSASNLVDTPAPGGAKLSERLELKIEDAGGTTVYSGPIGATGERDLGSFAAGESRTYSFTVSFPKGDDGNALAGARMSIEFDWLAQQAAQQDVQGEQEKGVTTTETATGDGTDGDDDGDVAGEQAEGDDGANGSDGTDGGTRTTAGGLPFTGLELAFAAIAGMLLLGTGLALRRRAA